MAAATADIDTPLRAGEVANLPVAANTLIYAGVLVAVDASGNANPASDTAGLVVVGRADLHTDNTTAVTGGAAGAVSVPVRRGVFGFQNTSGTYALTAADVLQTIACVLDNQTVARSGGTVNAIKAGLVVGIESGFVWIDTSRHTL